MSVPSSPIAAAPGEELDRAIPKMDLHPVTVELDLVDPALTA